MLSYLRIIVILVISSSIFCSCKKEFVNPDTQGRTTNLENLFYKFWLSMNYKYVYWDSENTDWDKVYQQYAPLFRGLNNTKEDRIKAASYLKEMTSTLGDNHFSIRFYEGALVNSYINPAMQKKSLDSNFHNRFEYDKVTKTYLDEGYLSAEGSYYDGVRLKILLGKVNESTLYFHFNVFALERNFNNSNNEEVKTILNSLFKALKSPTGINGIILDLRNNSGGDIVDLEFLGSKLINDNHIFGFSRSKDGLSKLGYLPWVKAELKHDPDYNLTCPLVILADNYSASLSEIMIIALKSKDTIVIGEQTYGATGPVSDSKIFYSGSFDIDNFMQIKTSSSQFRDIAGKNYEGVGISPDIKISFNYNALQAGQDLQLEKAIDHINKFSNLEVKR